MSEVIVNQVAVAVVDRLRLVLKLHDIPSQQVACLRQALQAAIDEIERLNAIAEDYDDVLRDCASYVGNGGYNSEGLIAPETARAKIRDGIDFIVRVESERRDNAASAAFSHVLRAYTEESGEGAVDEHLRDAIKALRPDAIIDPDGRVRIPGTR